MRRFILSTLLMAICFGAAAQTEHKDWAKFYKGGDIPQPASYMTPDPSISSPSYQAANWPGVMPR